MCSFDVSRHLRLASERMDGRYFLRNKWGNGLIFYKRTDFYVARLFSIFDRIANFLAILEMWLLIE